MSNAKELSLKEAKNKVTRGFNMYNFAELALQTNKNGMYLEELVETMFKLGWVSRAVCPCWSVYSALYGLMRKTHGNNYCIRIVRRDNPYNPDIQPWFFHKKFHWGEEKIKNSIDRDSNVRAS